MKTFTKTVLEKNMSIDDISEQLFFHTTHREPSKKREDVLLATVQELVGAIIAIERVLKFHD